MARSEAPRHFCRGRGTPLTLYYYASTPAASLSASIESIETNLSIDEPMEYPFTITNTGGQETGRITLALPEWMSAVTPATMPSLQPGEEATVVLKLASNSKMNLNMAVTGHLGINCEKGDGVSIPYSVIPVTEKTGKLRIEVCDQYTYYTEEAPHVAHADVTLSNPTTGLPVLLTDTGEEGYARWNFRPATISSMWWLRSMRRSATSCMSAPVRL